MDKSITVTQNNPDKWNLIKKHNGGINYSQERVVNRF